ncbi:shikimate dehydrogenase family protein [Bythopirellula polymerisocia]|uniref:Shikimate 5-dehydrogenase n=1 Tax=Bythopirellula polymerisocia TaxID=2528003 RepID=A0A5C6CBC7_9BACT|nr:shikimate dehydrogenase [Bythopirellula polymerisocia]TWU21385.1 shikimate 5-dehydrogenase [Bythopirellula polymerisocia]
MQTEATVVSDPKGKYPVATCPTLYFIGVTTGKSSIMKVFPKWAKALGLSGAVIRGIDFPLHADPPQYRRAVEHIKNDEHSLGALVTTHKIDLLKACQDLFDELDHFAKLTGEASCISKQGGKLVAHAKDPITSGLSLEAFLPAGHWQNKEAEILVLGAGGSSIALTTYLMSPKRGDNRPARIVVTDRSEPRLKEIFHVHQELDSDIPCQYHHCPTNEDNDRLVADLKPHSVVVNATGLGKDALGSPLTDNVEFPLRGFAWDFNYRGDLVFLDQARAQKQLRNLHVEDGWIYFLHGWTQVLAEVFHIDIPPIGPLFEELSRIAASTRN